MIAAIPAEDRPTIIVQTVPQEVALKLVAHHLGLSKPRSGVRCLSCGAKTDAEGQLPCGH
ncbi:hypothetical protein G5S34_17450 [Herbaspirillum frisingense]|uniref:hypothetical protein n=1 Tax=Herbaspirillum frisingense TaxID=92645 RepID=UPI0016018D5C|nr:hypothetical protein [Herbaspirillum frisingense]QNB08361.1 hypothetical protein G5S34_17450 [Herbaspirillum frisingense]